MIQNIPDDESLSKVRNVPYDALNRFFANSQKSDASGERRIVF
jgi:hypothetical protein